MYITRESRTTVPAEACEQAGLLTGTQVDSRKTSAPSWTKTCSKNSTELCRYHLKRGYNKKVAVKIVGDRGIGSLKVIPLPME